MQQRLLTALIRASWELLERSCVEKIVFIGSWASHPLCAKLAVTTHGVRFDVFPGPVWWLPATPTGSHDATAISRCVAARAAPPAVAACRVARALQQH